MSQPEPPVLVTTTNWHSRRVGSPVVYDGEDVTCFVRTSDPLPERIEPGERESRNPKLRLILYRSIRFTTVARFCIECVVGLADCDGQLNPLIYN